MSRGEGELLTVPKPRAVGLLSVCLTVKPVGEPDAGDRHVRFDERGWKTGRCQMAQATAPILNSTSRFCSITSSARASSVSVDAAGRAPFFKSLEFVSVHGGGALQPQRVFNLGNMSKVRNFRPIQNDTNAEKYPNSD